MAFMRWYSANTQWVRRARALAVVAAFCSAAPTARAEELGAESPDSIQLPAVVNTALHPPETTETAGPFPAEPLKIYIPNPSAPLPYKASEAAAMSVLDRQLSEKPAEMSLAPAAPPPQDKLEQVADDVLHIVTTPVMLLVKGVDSIAEHLAPEHTQIAAAEPEPAAPAASKEPAVERVFASEGAIIKTSRQTLDIRSQQEQIEQQFASNASDYATLAPAAGEEPAQQAVPVTQVASTEDMPAPELNDATRKTLAKIPSGLDSKKKGKKGKPERITIDHETPIVAVTSAPAAAPAAMPVISDTAATSGATLTTSAAPAAPATAAEATPALAPNPYNISIERGRPRPDVNYELERAYNSLITGNTEAAIARYSAALDAEPTNQQALFGLAATYHRIGQIDKARPLYSRLLKINPTHREGLNNFLALAAAEAPESAMTELQALEERNPDFSPIPAQIAAIYQKQGNTGAAIDKMMRAVALSPENFTYRYNLAILFDAAGRRQEAAHMYQQLVEASSRGESLPGDIQAIQQRLTFLRSNRP